MLKLAPDARVVTPFVGMARMADTHEFPIERLLLINPGQKFSAGDREFTVFRPPNWDSPATHGCFDSKTKTLFCADSLGGFIPGPAENVTDIAEAAFTEGFQTFASALSPWLHLTDQAKFDAHVNAVRQFEPEMILSSHGLVAKGKLDPLLKTLSSVPSMEPFVGPDHDAMIAMMAEAPPAP